jgi:DNA-binding response OmpR family regulator
MADTKKKVLIVEDDKTLQVVLKAVFAKAGFDVVSALDAMQGLMYAKSAKPDLIVLDIMMPAGSGISVYERLQQSTAVATPVLIYSAAPKEEIAEKIQEGPGVEILSKPASPDELIAAAKRLLGLAA